MSEKIGGVFCKCCRDRLYYDVKGFRSCLCEKIRIDVGNSTCRVIGDKKDFTFIFRRV